MPIKKIIALSGFKGSGKDTVANIIKEINESRYDKYYAILSFANPVRKIVDNVFFGSDCKRIQYYKENKEEKIEYLSKQLNRPVTYRYLLNTVGQNMKKSFGDSIWVNCMENEIEYIEDSVSNKSFINTNIVITDVRFKNEIKFLQKLKNKYEVEHWLIMRKECLPDWVKQGLNVNNKVEKRIIIKDFKPSVPEFEWCVCNPKFNRMIINDGTIEELKQKIIDII